MAINFPDTPTDGQVFTVGATSWTWYTTPGLWRITSGPSGYTGSKGTTYIDDNPPASPVNGDTWLDSSEGIRYVYYADGTSSQWIQESTIGPRGYPGYTGSASTVIGFTGSQGDLGYTGSTVYPSAGIAVSTGTAWGTSKTTPTGDVVGTTDTQTLSGKTLSNATVTNYVETIHSPAAASSFTVNLDNGTIQKFATNGNATVTLPTSIAGKSFVIMIAYGGAHTLTWAGGSTIKWAGGSPPTATSVSGKFDIFTFFQDGINTYGTSFGSNF